MDYDVIVIGGGHAGIEAAMAAARMGVSVLMITQQLDAIGRLSCNPSVGGVAKGNIVREIDALGGVMAQLIDRSMIQFRVLNRSRGPAVQAYRSQADKHLYSALAKSLLERQPHLSLFQDTVTDFMLNEQRNAVAGVITERGNKISARTVVLTTGTFMEGKVFIGDYETSSGRLGEPAAVGLGTSLRRLGFSVARLKTGTPARVHRDSIDYSVMERQDGDRLRGDFVGSWQGGGFSFSSDGIDRPDVPCWLTYTNEHTHEIIRNNIHRSPLYAGKIQGVGPRYCPSIEDKVMRFPDRTRHHVFIEPEGLTTDEMYLNGLSSSLPEDVQRDFIRSVSGLENAVIMRPAYAVEYDYLDPRQLKPSLETKMLAGLFTAGQTNGTSGYEEAAGQGCLAGINAVLSLRNESPLVLARDEAYLGVLVDDLVTLGTKEPYRMFTARAEYRLRLRHDTADERLMPKAYAAGALPHNAIERLSRRLEQRDEVIELLRTRRVSTEDVTSFAVTAAGGINDALKGKTFASALCDPSVTLEILTAAEPKIAAYSSADRNRAYLDLKYEHYIENQNRSVQRMHKMENMKIPESFDYDAVAGLSAESCIKLKQVRPTSLGQAARISGIRTSDIMLLMIKLR